MFEGYVTALLLRFAKKFIQDPPDLKLSLWGTPLLPEREENGLTW